MTNDQTSTAEAPWISIAVFAWNEEKAIPRLLESLFAQTVFPELARRGQRAEVFCVLNGCTDESASVARRYFRGKDAGRIADWRVRWEVIDLPERGKLNAWNHFVHHLSDRQARYLVMMDADIIIHQPGTLWSLVETLEQDSYAEVSVDLPCKDIAFKKRAGIGERLSLKASTLTRAAEAQLCAQLYCMRSSTARSIYMPRDLPACEDGFIKALVCTEFLGARQPVDAEGLKQGNSPGRIRLAREAEHTFEAYTNPWALLKNQKRQIIGQTVVHLLVDRHLKSFSLEQRRHLAETVRGLEETDPGWLRRLIQAHANATRFCWRLCPGYVGTGLKRWRRLPTARKPAALPAAVGHFALALCASYLAHRALRQGCTHYWPRAERRSGSPGLENQTFIEPVTSSVPNP